MRKIDGLSPAKAAALLKWHLVRERTKSPWSVYKGLIQDGYLHVNGGRAPSEPNDWMVVTQKGKDWCDANHLNVVL